jgi:hypothetical protein
MSNDIWTTINRQLSWQLHFPLFLLVENKRERIKTYCEYERESCQQVVGKWLSKYHFSLKIYSMKLAAVEYSN